MLTVVCTNEEKVVGITANPVTASGNPAQVDGPLRITVVSGDGTFAQDAAAPLKFDAISGPGMGDTEYSVEADADMGAGTILIRDTLVLSVTGAQAASFGLSGGTVVPK